MQQQTKLEENELDDAISVFRNHCEPHPMGMPMTNMDNSNYAGPSPLVNTIGPAAQDNPTNEPPTTIKLERVPSNSSISNLCSTISIDQFLEEFLKEAIGNS